MNIIDIENKSDLTKITFKNILIWMLIRGKIELANFTNETGYSMNLRTSNIKILIQSVFYGFLNFFFLRKFNFLFFTNNDKRYLIENKLKDIFFDDIADKVGQERSLFIEFSTNRYSKRKKSYSKHIISDLPLKLISRFFSLFICTSMIKNLNIIKELAIENDLPINITKTIRQALGEYYFYNLFFKFIKPKKIFLICYYSKSPMVFAARNNNIETIEYQHGIITKNCSFYNSPYNHFTKYFPNILLTMGTNLVEDYPHQFIFNKANIFPIGSFYIDYIKYKFNSNKLWTIKQSYKKIVCVTSSGANLNILMDFVKRLSIKHPNFLFILRPKHSENIRMYLSSNIVFIPEFDIYQILKYSDYNITIQSFVAYEADYYGVYNILFNVGGLARLYFKNDIFGEFVEPYNYKDYNLPDTSNLPHIKNEKYFSDYSSIIKIFPNE